MPVLTKHSCKQCISCKQHPQWGCSGTISQAKYRIPWFSSFKPCRQHCHHAHRWEQGGRGSAAEQGTHLLALCHGAGSGFGLLARVQDGSRTERTLPPIHGEFLEKRLIINIFLPS